jgi:hypothetical protein
MSRQSYVAQRARTLDRGPPDANRAPVYTVGVIGEKRKTLADGSLSVRRRPDRAHREHDVRAR